VRVLIAGLVVLCLAVAALPAWADYNNGPINGTVDAWTINFGFVLSDSFVPDGSSVTGLMFGVWEFPGDNLLSVDWSITRSELGGGTLGSGTAVTTDRFISVNQYGYDIDEITVTGLNVGVTPGNMYWLNLENAVISTGDPVYWDENSGIGCSSPGCPSEASTTATGSVPTEAFTINTGERGGTTPEPSTFMLFASGVLGMAGLLRLKFRSSR
jgi:hypothetical protein